MKVIPVLDIKNAQVVLAHAGERERYKAVNTALCKTSSPAAVIEAFLDVFPFDTFYIADLDAIEGKPTNQSLIHQLSSEFDSLTFLLDRGRPQKEAYYLKNNLPVFGTESYQSTDELQETLLASHKTSAILSLDYKHGTLLGCPTVEQRPQLWTDPMIILDISAVGTEHGFNFELLKPFDIGKQKRELIIGGGIRDFEQMQTAAHLGIASILVASCLHHKLITHSHIRQLGEIYP